MGRRIQIEKKKKKKMREWEMVGCGLGWTHWQDGDDGKGRCECPI
jgi:hypothetical protein